MRLTTGRVTSKIVSCDKIDISLLGFHDASDIRGHLVLVKRVNMIETHQALTSCSRTIGDSNHALTTLAPSCSHGAHGGSPGLAGADVFREYVCECGGLRQVTISGTVSNGERE